MTKTHTDGRRTNGGQRRKEHCFRGHSLATAYICDGGRYRRCRDCDRDRSRRRASRSVTSLSPSSMGQEGM